jgi:hypothetical protein
MLYPLCIAFQLNHSHSTMGAPRIHLRRGAFSPQKSGTSIGPESGEKAAARAATIRTPARPCPAEEIAIPAYVVIWIGGGRQDRTADLRVMKTPISNTINYLHGQEYT